MPKRRQSSEELEQLFQLAKKDVPTVEVQQSLRAATQLRIERGEWLQYELPELAEPSASILQALPWKAVLAVGCVILAISAVVLVRRGDGSRDTSPRTEGTIVPSPVSAPAMVTSSIAPVVAASSLPLESEPVPADRLRAVKNQTEKVVGSGPSEASLIDQAQKELRNNPRGALALTETHRRLYPKGVLRQEREVIAIEALQRLGKAGAAHKRATSFRAKEPNSIHESHLRSVLGDAGDGAQP